jgi:hypothetical protein
LHVVLESRHGQLRSKPRPRDAGKAWRRQVLETFQPQAADRKKSRAVPGITIVACILAPPACTTGILGPRGPIGAAEKSILIDPIAIMLAIVAPTIVAIFGFSWWFRASGTRAHHLPGWTPI